MNPRYPVIATRAGYRCEYCHAPQVISNSHFEVEHIHPASRGGGEHDDNLALACPSCNVFKAAALSAVDPASGELVVLFHPRLHVWAEHFEVNDTTLQIHGLTATGRATVECLRMNRDLSVLARGYWAMIGLFP